MQEEPEPTRRARRVTRLSRLMLVRLGSAWGWPMPGAWGATLVVACAYLLVALPIALGAGLIEPAPRPGFAAPATTLLRVLILPALVEELLFRVLANPHPHERAGKREVYTAAILSLSAYVGAHPLIALLARTTTLFTSPAFLLLTTLLGAACLLLYRRSGSIWPPVALHWLVVSGWLMLGGEGLLPVG